MQQITLTPVPVTPAILASLEERKLIRTFSPTPQVLKPRKSSGAVSTFYTSKPKHGTHKLICIGKRSVDIKLSSHSDNEDFILINTTDLVFKPLYLVIALHKHAVLETKAAKGALSPDDFVALEMKFNDPKTCVFTMLKDVPHCEVTVPGEGMHPIFFVTEPSGLKMNWLRLPGLGFALGEVRKPNRKR